MSLDDRLRGAYQRRLDDVRQTVDVADREFVASSSDPSARLLLVGAAAGLVIIGLFALSQLLPRSSTESIETADVSQAELTDGDGTETDAIAPPTTEASTPSLSVQTSTPSIDGAPGPTTRDQPPVSSTREEAEVPTTTGSTASSSATSVPTTTSAAPDRQPVAGVTNDVCPSGSRAELEWAALRYVGTSRGWGRMADLVDEQDGPYYFEAWEPNFTDPVSVEILLTDPVLATDIRVAQDPFTPVSGTIFIEAAEQRLALELSGTDGWQVHEFDQPVLIDRLTVRREAEESNIMEILVCTSDTSTRP